MEENKRSEKVVSTALVATLVLAAFLCMPLVASASTGPSIYVDKRVQDADGVWVDWRDDVSIGEFLTFRIEITKGGTDTLLSIHVNDFFSDCLEYADNARLELYLLDATTPALTIPIEPPDYMGHEYDEWLIEWILDDELDGFGGLNIGDTLYLYFDAEVIDFGWGYGYNCVDVFAPVMGLHEDDCVDLMFGGVVSVDVDKRVLDPVSGDWVDGLDAYVDDTLTFEIDVLNDGEMPLDGIFVRDTLSDGLEYIPGSASPEEPWDIYFNPYDGSTELSWDPDGLNVDETLTITFAARVTLEGEETNYVWVHCYGGEMEDDDEDTVIIRASLPTNHPPEADANGPYVANEGTLIAFDASGSSDPDGDLLEYRWDFDDDGAWDTGWSGAPGAAHTWFDDWDGTAKVEVSDGDLTDDDTADVTVLNVAPLVEAGDDQTVDEGELVSFSGSFTDPGLEDTHTYEWDFGDGATASGTLTPTHTYADNGGYIVSLTVTDDDGGESTGILTVTVNNVAPTVDVGPDQTVDEGDPVIFSGSFTDPGSDDTHTYEWDFGDGGTESETLAPTHTYVDDGDYTVTLTVTDDDGGVGADTLIVTVNNVAPTVDAGPDHTVDEGDPVIFSGSFTDPGSEDTHTIAWDFGDSATESGTLTPTHTYVDDGDYTVTLTVEDDDGGVGTDMLTVTVNEGEVQQSDLYPDEYRWGDPAPGYSFANWPIFESWMDAHFVNSGPGDAFNVEASISYAPVNVNIVDGDVTLGDIPAGGSAWSTDSFTLEVDMTNPQGPDESVKWTVEYDDAAGNHHVILGVPQFSMPG